MTFNNEMEIKMDLNTRIEKIRVAHLALTKAAQHLEATLHECLPVGTQLRMPLGNSQALDLEVVVIHFGGDGMRAINLGTNKNRGVSVHALLNAHKLGRVSLLKVAQEE